MSQKIFEHPGYEYKWIAIALIPKPAVSFETPSFEDAANYWASKGWRTIGFSERAASLFLERVKLNPYNPTENETEFEKWRVWDEKYGSPYDRRAMK